MFACEKSPKVRQDLTLYNFTNLLTQLFEGISEKMGSLNEFYT